MTHQRVTNDFPTAEFPPKAGREGRTTTCSFTRDRCFRNGSGRHATDPPHRLRPRKAATSRGPNSNSHNVTIIHAVWKAQACFATACTVGIPAFIIRRDGRPSCNPFRALPRRTATLSGFCDVTLTDLKVRPLDVGLFEKDGRRRASLPSKPVESRIDQRDCKHEP
jgi:hypothetical protein